MKAAIRYLCRIIPLVVLVTSGCGSPPSETDDVLVAEALTEQPPGPRGHREVCAGPAAQGEARCYAHVRTDAKGYIQPFLAPQGFGTSDLQSAYQLPGSGGAGKTVAIVDAYDDPNAESDLAVYRAQYGLSACTSANGCFRKVNQNGVQGSYPIGNTGWAEEISLDLDMVSAACPNCKILLVEAASSTNANLYKAENTAVALGAAVVSNSWGEAEYSGEQTDEQTYFHHVGVAITVSSGDSDYGAQFPAASQYVTAVGGTNLAVSANARGWSETVWTGTGSGCSAFVTKPGWQHDASCAKRTIGDVSAIADPNTGVAVYDTYGGVGGWLVFGGTSVSSPLVAAIFAVTGHAATDGSLSYANSADFFDVTSGSNGSCGGTYLCTGEVGYDGPTGNGTPSAALLGAPTGPDFTIAATPASQTVIAPGSAAYTVSTAPVGDGTVEAITLSVSGLPAGVTGSFDPASINSGESTVLTIIVPAGQASSTTTFTVTGTAASGSHGASAGLTVTGAQVNEIKNGDFELGNLSSWSVAGSTGAVKTPHTGIYSARLGLTTRTNGDSSASQAIAVPATGTTTLSFWYRGHCTGGVTRDWATVTVTPSGKSPVTVLGHTCTNTGAWVNDTFNLTPYAGKSVTLKLVSHDDDQTRTPNYTFYDDVTAINQ
jgi:hypothetical protein